MVRRKIAVIGLGDFGVELVKSLYIMGHEVLALDRDMERIEYIKEFSTTAVCLDSTNERAMRSQGLDEMDVVILASAESFETLVFTTDILKRIGAKEIVARVRKDLHERILSLLGVAKTFNPEQHAAEGMAVQLTHSYMKRSVILSGEYSLVEIESPESMVGLTVADAGFRRNYDLNLVTMKRKHHGGNEEVLGTPQGEDVIRRNDLLVFFGRKDDISRFLDNNS